MSDENRQFHKTRAARAYAATRRLRGGLGADPRRLGRAAQADERPMAASDAPTMSFADSDRGYVHRSAPQSGRGDDLRSDLSRGFGFGVGFAAGTGLFRVIVFALGWGALMLVLLSLLGAIL
ncbi:MAG: hypothetical protein AAF684_07655 [Pseudomonadota bacterium]